MSEGGRVVGSRFLDTGYDQQALRDFAQIVSSMEMFEARSSTGGASSGLAVSGQSSGGIEKEDKRHPDKRRGSWC